MKFKLFTSECEGSSRRAHEIETMVNFWLEETPGCQIIKSETTQSVISITTPTGLRLEGRLSMAIWYEDKSSN